MKNAQHLPNEIITEILSALTEVKSGEEGLRGSHEEIESH